MKRYDFHLYNEMYSKLNRKFGFNYTEGLDETFNLMLKMATEDVHHFIKSNNKDFTDRKTIYFIERLFKIYSYDTYLKHWSKFGDMTKKEEKTLNKIKKKRKRLFKLMSKS
jgi:hypothetical protein